MNYSLQKLQNFKKRPGPVVLIILDGVGIGKKDKGDAFYLARPENILNWMGECSKKGLYTELKAHGPAVGLPSEQDMGNSEVGHNAMGSGQIYSQGAKLVNQALDSGSIFKTDTWEKIVCDTAKDNKTVHLIGLLSDGNVHSHIDQLFKLMDGIIKSGVKKIRIHPLLDGRDVAPDSGLIYIDKLEQKLANLESQKPGVDAKIASGGGRMHITMDRYYSNWEIVKRGWDAHVRGVVSPKEITDEYKGYFKSAKEAIEVARKIYPDKLDQFNPPFVIVDEQNKPVGKMENGDAVINFNFRGDRAIEISQAFMEKDFDAFDRVEYPDVKYAGLLEYDSDKHIPKYFLLPPPSINNVSAQYICSMNIPSYAIAETHKFGHVTYFWNGNKTGYIDEKLEKYEEVQSEPNEMIEAHPQMKAKEVTEKLLAALQSKQYEFLRVNYANGDMVGHTGNIDSCIKSVQTLNTYVPMIVDEVYKQHGVVIISADHGNVEEKLDKKNKIKTSHTLNPVPCYILDSCYNGEYIVDTQHIQTPGIANIASTFINLLGYAAPEFYEKSLLTFK